MVNLGGTKIFQIMLNNLLDWTYEIYPTGDGLHGVPIHRMCIINMAMSDEAIINYLLSETMRVERKEFEGQKRSNENDIILHRQRLAKEHVSTVKPV